MVLQSILTFKANADSSRLTDVIVVVDAYAQVNVISSRLTDLSPDHARVDWKRGTQHGLLIETVDIGLTKRLYSRSLLC